jgi:hypothetical protein
MEFDKLNDISDRLHNVVGGAHVTNQFDNVKGILKNDFIAVKDDVNVVKNIVFAGDKRVNGLMVGEGMISGVGFFGLLVAWPALAVALLFATTGVLGIGQKWLMNNAKPTVPHYEPPKTKSSTVII